VAIDPVAVKPGIRPLVGARLTDFLILSAKQNNANILLIGGSIMALPTKEELGFDPDALRDKYRAERDKRLREDANEQYREIKDEYVDFLIDPYIANPTS
jgi:hypothetical protein